MTTQTRPAPNRWIACWLILAFAAALGADLFGGRWQDVASGLLLPAIALIPAAAACGLLALLARR